MLKQNFEYPWGLNSVYLFICLFMYYLWTIKNIKIEVQLFVQYT